MNEKMKQIEWFWNRMYFSIFEFYKKTKVLPIRFSTSDYIMMAFTCLLEWALANFISILFPCLSLAHLDKKTFIFVTGVPCLLINYYFLWRKDKHFKYFEVFAKENRKVKRKWNYITLTCLLFSFVMFIFSMVVMGR